MWILLSSTYFRIYCMDAWKKTKKNNVSRSNLDNECITSLCMWIVIESVDQNPSLLRTWLRKISRNGLKIMKSLAFWNGVSQKPIFKRLSTSLISTMYEPSIYVFFLLYLVAFLNIMHYAKVCAFYSEVLEHKHSSNSNIAASMYIKN